MYRDFYKQLPRIYFACILVSVKKVFRLLIFVIGCELVGIIGSVFTISAIPTWYATLLKPSFSPPNWVFGPVWTLLYALMGTAGFLLWNLGSTKKKVARVLFLFWLQLGLNFIWTPVFFGLKSPEFALCIIIPMWITTLLTIRGAYPLSKWAALALVPYLLWISFASILNASIMVLN